MTTTGQFGPMTMRRRWRWLESTVELQREAYGHHRSDAPALQAQSVRENVLALIVEATEILDNVSWKYWAHDEPFADRGEVLREAVDAGHFLANILVAVGVTDDEWEDAYRAKQAENLRRQRDGYRVRSKR